MPERNTTTAVQLTRRGGTVVFDDTLLALVDHYISVS